MREKLCKCLIIIAALLVCVGCNTTGGGSVGSNVWDIVTNLYPILNPTNSVGVPTTNAPPVVTNAPPTATNSPPVVTNTLPSSVPVLKTQLRTYMKPGGYVGVVYKDRLPDTTSIVDLDFKPLAATTHAGYGLDGSVIIQSAQPFNTAWKSVYYKAVRKDEQIGGANAPVKPGYTYLFLVSVDNPPTPVMDENGIAHWPTNVPVTFPTFDESL